MPPHPHPHPPRAEWESGFDYPNAPSFACLSTHYLLTYPTVEYYPSHRLNIGRWLCKKIEKTLRLVEMRVLHGKASRA